MGFWRPCGNWQGAMNPALERKRTRNLQIFGYRNQVLVIVFLHKRRLHMKRYLSMLLSLVLVFTAKTTKSIATSKTTVKLSKLDASKDYYLIPEVLIHTF